MFLKSIGMFGVFSRAVLADGFGVCSYSSHTGQAAAVNIDAAKPVAPKSTDKINAEKIILTQTEKSNKPADILARRPGVLGNTIPSVFCGRPPVLACLHSTSPFSLSRVNAYPQTVVPWDKMELR